MNFLSLLSYFPNVLWVGVVAGGVDAVEELLDDGRVDLAVLLAVQVLPQLLQPQLGVRLLRVGQPRLGRRREGPPRHRQRRAGPGHAEADGVAAAPGLLQRDPRGVSLQRQSRTSGGSGTVNRPAQCVLTLDRIRRKKQRALKIEYYSFYQYIH